MSVTVLLALLFLYLFFRNVRTGQYDDIYTPSVRMLFDDELVKDTSKKKDSPLEKNTKTKELN